LKRKCETGFWVIFLGWIPQTSMIPNIQLLQYCMMIQIVLNLWFQWLQFASILLQRGLIYCKGVWLPCTGYHVHQCFTLMHNFSGIEENLFQQSITSHYWIIKMFISCIPYHVWILNKQFLIFSVQANPYNFYCFSVHSENMCINFKCV